MAETVESQEPETLKVTIHDPNKVDLKDFKFKTAKQLDKKMKTCGAYSLFWRSW